MRDVLTLAAPPGLIVDVTSLEQALGELRAPRPDRATTMVLVKSPHVAHRLWTGGVTYSKLNVGGLGMAPGRRTVFKNIALSDEEFALLRDLHARGVQITLLTVPGEKAKDFADLLER